MLQKKDNKQLQHETVSSGNSTAALLINPFTLHADHNAVSQSAAASINSPSTTAIQQHQNVRDMDIVHVIIEFYFDLLHKSLFKCCTLLYNSIQQTQLIFL